VRQETLVCKILLTMSFSNAEAGLALICTCLPAFVGEFRHFKGRVRHAISTVLNTSSDNVVAEGEKTIPLRFSPSVRLGQGTRRMTYRGTMR